MCGRFSLTSTPETLARRFGLAEAPRCTPRYNVAPGQPVLAVRADAAGTRRAEPLRWGLVPAWAESAALGARWINARAETAATRPAFRAAFQERRCIVPADGFYEWAPRGDLRQPYWIAPVDGEPLGIAALWERWQAPDGAALESCALLTTDASADLRSLHARMPAVLAPEDYADWLAGGPRDTADLAALLRPLPERALRFHPVTTRVNRVEIDDPTLIDAVAEPPRQPSLFDAGGA